MYHHIHILYGWNKKYQCMLYFTTFLKHLESPRNLDMLFIIWYSWVIVCNYSFFFKLVIIYETCSTIPLQWGNFSKFSYFKLKVRYNIIFKIMIFFHSLTLRITTDTSQWHHFHWLLILAITVLINLVGLRKINLILIRRISQYENFH